MSTRLPGFAAAQLPEIENQIVDLFRRQGLAPGRHQFRGLHRIATAEDRLAELIVGELAHLLGVGVVARRDGKPARGLVDAFAIAQGAMALDAVEAIGLLCRRRPGRGTSGSDRQGAIRWWSDGVGRVQYQSSDLYQLTSYDMPTPTFHTTWGAVKRLYQ